MTDQMTGQRWDEPAGAASPRGWLHRAGTCVGFYLDYGPDHYRSPHEYCQPGRECRDCQPGNVLAVRYPNGPGAEPRTSAWVETVAQAREFVTGTDCAVCAAQARLKGGTFWADRARNDWPRTTVAGHPVHKACQSAADHLARHASSITIDEHGVGRWAESGQVFPDDTAALIDALDLAARLDLAATAAARQVETAAAIAAYAAAQAARTPDQVAEHEADMRAAFGPGAEVTDVLTGKVTRL